MGEPARSDERREYRKKVLKGGAILRGISHSEIACVIRNMHTSGAELSVPPNTQLPQEFLLYVKVDGIAYRSQVRWRNGNRVGVMFLGTEPKPHWHYG